MRASIARTRVELRRDCKVGRPAWQQRREAPDGRLTACSGGESMQHASGTFHVSNMKDEPYQELKTGGKLTRATGDQAYDGRHRRHR